MVIDTVLWLGLVAAALVVGELILNKLHRENEASRKLLHIVHAIGLAGLAFILPVIGIIAFELTLLFVMLVARYLNTHYDKQWKWVHYLGKNYRVDRESYGDLLFPISAIAVALLANSEWEFAVAVLILGLADAAAALVGKKWGKSTSYRVFGQTKSLHGSLAFFVVALAVSVGYSLLDQAYPGGILPLIAISALLTGVENIGVYGSDNLLLPLATVWLFNLL